MPKATKSSKSATKAPAKKVAATKAAPVKKAAGAVKKAAVAVKKGVAKKAPSTKAAPAPAKKAAPATKAPAATKAAAAAKAPAKKAAPAPAPAPAPKAAAPVKKAPPKRTAAMDKFFEGQRVALLEEREVYARQATTLRAEADQLAQDRDPGDVQFDEESGQGDSMNVERERDLALSAQALASIDEIDRALGKIVAGTYGICEKCGESIPKERLKALPFASLCVTCKSGGLSRR
jgi:RNA polymerase-binding transcription factor DksA